MDRVSQSVFLGGEPDVDGSGIRVAVIDTGVDEEHPDLVHSLDEETSRSFVELDRTLEDNSGHGTHVAGIIAGTGSSSDGRYRGIAPGVALTVLKISTFWHSQTDVLAAAVEAALDANVDIINYSGGLGGWDKAKGPPPWKWSSPKDIASRAFELAADEGVLCVVSAGNDGDYEGSINRPAFLSSALAVGALDRNGQVAPGSSRGPVYLSDDLPRNTVVRRADPAFGDEPEDLIKPDVVVPGGNVPNSRKAVRAFYERVLEYMRVDPDGIVSTRPPKGSMVRPLDLVGRKRRYGRMSGTSQAAPVVTGLAALALQYAAERGLEWGPDRAQALANLLRSAARRPSAAGGSSDYGHGSLMWVMIRELIEDCLGDPVRRKTVFEGPQLRLL